MTLGGYRTKEYGRSYAHQRFPDAAMSAMMEGAAMTVKVDDTEPNIFPAVEYLDARDAGRNVEVFLEVKIEGKLFPVTVRLSYQQAEALAHLLEPFRKD
jgi:hypothetical protein